MGNGTPSGVAGPSPKDKTQKAEAFVTIQSTRPSSNKMQHTDQAYCSGLPDRSSVASLEVPQLAL